jgi:hypothetical protein
MKKLFGIVAALFIVFYGSVTYAAIGDSYERGMNPHSIAELMRTYLKEHPGTDGMGLLTPDKCHQAKEKSCATMWAYLQSFKNDDPNAGLTSITQLPDYLDSLVLMEPKDLAYNMDVVLPQGADVYGASTGALVRHFEPGEKAWGNPKTHRIVMAGNCGNPIEGEQEEVAVTAASPCVPMTFRIPQGAVGIHGEFASASKIYEPARCPIFCDDQCNFDRAEKDLPFVVADHRVFSLKSDGSSTVTLQVARSFIKEGIVLMVCADFGNKKMTKAARVFFHGSAPATGQAFPSKYQFPDGTFAQ